MKILLVDIFNKNETTELTEEEFYERYDTATIDLDDYKGDPDWEILYVADDPYWEEIWGELRPLVDNTLECLREQVLLSQEEI